MTFEISWLRMDARKQKLKVVMKDALAYMYSKQIIHRDLKPSNIMVTHTGQYRETKSTIGNQVIDYQYWDKE